jgi:hypothetical protein
MKKITKEEAGKFMLRKGSSSPVRTAVANMHVGDVLLIEKQDWKQQNGPGQMLTRVKKSTGMEFKLNSIATGEGWIVERVK